MINTDRTNKERKKEKHQMEVVIRAGFSISNRAAGDLLITAGDLILQKYQFVYRHKDKN